MAVFQSPRTGEELKGVVFKKRYDPEFSNTEAALLFARIRCRVEILAGKGRDQDYCDRVVLSLFENARGSFPSLEEFERELKRIAVEYFC
jgi:hypothetical protein